MGHIERRQKEKEEMRQRILEVARQIGAEEGWHSLTIRKIADRIEYTPPVVYEHFSNKEDLIKEIVYSGFDMMNEEFTQARKSEIDPKQLIKKISLIHWDFAFNNTEIYRLMFSLERPNPSEEMLESIKLIEGTFLSFIKEKESLHEIIFSWMCMMTGAISFIMKFPNSPHKQGRDPRETFIRIINRFIESL